MPSICPECGFENPSRARICANCAAPLGEHCSICGFENPSGFKYCGNCGANLLAAKLPDSAGPDTLRRLQVQIPGDLAEQVLRSSKQLAGERRNVTILFADVVGFTALAERLDPEQVYNIIDAVQKAFLEEIYKHEGWFDKFLGDGVMAIFGAPIAHEDDPMRAVSAALDMQRALKRLNEEFDPRLNVNLSARIGLNSGTVVVATMGSDMRMNYTPLGDVVNVASRLQTYAEADTIVVNRAVYEATKPIFEFRDLGEIRLKGRAEAVGVFQVIGKRHAPGHLRGIPGLSAPLVGREKEFAQLSQFGAGWLRSLDGRFVLVVGEAGLGKSRLATEFIRSLGERELTVVQAAALAYGQSAYDVFSKLLRGLLMLSPDEDDPLARERVQEQATRVLGDRNRVNQILPYLSYLLSIRITHPEMADRIRHLGPVQLQQQIFLAVRDVLMACARTHPVVLLLEDLHWIDKPSLDLLLFLLDSIENAPLLILATSREKEGQATSLLDRAARQRLAGRYLRLPLERLALPDAATLVEKLLLFPDVPLELKQLVQQRAEGNPFYLEETIRMLIDRGILGRAGDSWKMTPGIKLTELQVPRTLQDLIMTRVDHLREGPRHTLQCAAVIGRTFSERLLYLVVGASAENIKGDLRELREHELIQLVGETPETMYAFRNQTVQTTVYGSLLQRRRERLHFKIAEQMEQIYRDRLDDHIESIAFHYSESRDPVRALAYLIRAGERAATRYANDQALRFFHTALNFLSTALATPAQRVAIYRGLADVQSVMGNYDLALQNYRNALEIARSSESFPARQVAELARQVARVNERKGNYEEAFRWLETALDEIDHDPTSMRVVERVRIYLEMGWLYYQRGDHDKAYQWTMRSLEISEGTDYYLEMGSAYNGLVPLFVAKGDWNRALAYGDRGLKLRERIGDIEGMARSYNSLGAIAGFQGEWDRAIDYNERALDLAHLLGHASTTILSLNNLGLIQILKGNAPAAREFLDRARTMGDQSGDAHLLCQTLNYLAQVALLEHRSDEAAEMLKLSMQYATQTGNKNDLVESYRLTARLNLERGGLDQAHAMAQGALAFATEAGLKQEEGLARRTLGMVQRAQGDSVHAETNLTSAYEIFQGVNNRYELARTQVELARLAAQRQDVLSTRREALQALSTFVVLGAEADRRIASDLLQENGKT